MAEDFAVGERAIDCRAHGAEIALADFRVDRRAGELAVDEFDARRFCRHHHFLEEFGANLVAEPARAAMDGDDNVVRRKPEGLRDLGVEDFRDDLNLEIVVARAERAHLAPLSLSGAFGDVLGLRARHPAVFLNSFEVAKLRPTRARRPNRRHPPASRPCQSHRA